MRLNLTLPKSINSAFRRLHNLAEETKRIRAQLTDPKRTERPNYPTWFWNAKGAQVRIEEEHERVIGWLAIELIKEARDALEALSDEIEFEPDEHTLLKNLDTFLAEKD